MATILEFPRQGMRSSVQARLKPLAAPADIVIFPGVQVRYWTEQDLSNQGSAPGRSKSRRKKDATEESAADR
jgi:hypothetical protein